MNVNIRGTSGSGKSYIVHSLLKEFDTITTPLHMEGRKRPWGYKVGLRSPVIIMGHYETACGGCDTLPNMDFIFEKVSEQAKKGYHVLFEGVLVSEERKRSIMLEDLLIVKLSTPVEECLKSINKRRREKNPEAEDVNPKNTTNRVRTIDRACSFIEENSNARIVSLSRGSALRLVRSILFTNQK